MSADKHPEAKTKINSLAEQAFFVQDYTGAPRIDGVEIVKDVVLATRALVPASPRAQSRTAGRDCRRHAISPSLIY